MEDGDLIDAFLEQVRSISLPVELTLILFCVAWRILYTTTYVSAIDLVLLLFCCCVFVALNLFCLTILLRPARPSHSHTNQSTVSSNRTLWFNAVALYHVLSSWRKPLVHRFFLLPLPCTRVQMFSQFRRKYYGWLCYSFARYHKPYCAVFITLLKFHTAKYL